MVRLRVEVEVQSEQQAEAVMSGLRTWCEGNDGCRVVGHRESHPRCPECHGLMTFEPALQEWVCHHEEQGDFSSAIGPATLPPG